jgi:hypothetical protein
MADQIDIDNLVNQLREATVAMNRLGGTAATGSTGSKDINRLIQALARLGEKFDRTSKSQKQRDKDIQDFIDDVDSAAKSIEDLDKAAQEQARAAEELAAELERSARRASLSSEQLAAEEARDRKAARNKQARAELEQLRARQAKEVNYSALLARARMDELAQTKTLQARLESLGDTITDRFGTDAVKTQMAMIKLQGAIKKTQESAQQLTSAFVRGIGDLAMSMGSFATDVGDGAKSFTQFNGLIDSVTNALGEMAKAIPFAGEAISGAMKLAAEGAKFVLDQLQKTADSFNELGDIGALTAGGLTEFRQAQLDTGVSLDVFKKAIADNSTTLARFSGTVGSGTQRFTKVLTPLTKQGSETSAELRRLGFTLGDISEATGNYIGLQTRLGRAQRKSNEELSQGAAQYAKELDLLAKLTGKSRKDLQAQQEAALSEGRFRAVIDELGQTGPAGEKAAKELLDFQTRVSAVSSELGQAIRDTSTNFTNSEAAVKGFNSTSGQLGPIIDQLKSGAISQDEAYRRLQAALGSNIETQREYAKAMGDDGPFVRLNEALDVLRGEAQDGAKALKDQAGQVAGQDQLTEETVRAQQGMEQLSIRVQELAFNAMPDAVKAINAFEDTLNEFVKVISEKLGMEGLAGPAGPPQEVTPDDIEKLNDGTKALSDAIDIAVDPTKMIADAEAREDAVQRQQDANYKLATRTEKAGIILGEAINDTAEIIGSGFDLIGLDRIGQTFTALGKSGREARVASQVETLRETGRMAPAAGGGKAGGAAPGGAGAPKAGGGAPAVPQAGGGGPPQGAVDVAQLFNFGSGTGSQAHFDKLDPGFKQSLINLAHEYNQSTGRKLTLNSAYRSPEEQARINSGGNPKAAPGRSKHNVGLAADLNSNEVAFLKQAGLLSKYGFKTLDNDPPHIYMKDGGVIPATQGGTRVIAGEAGKNEAFVPLPDGRRIPVVLENFDIQDLVNAIKGVTKAPTARDTRASDISRSIVDAIRPLTQSFEQVIAETTAPMNNMVAKLQSVTQGAVRTPGLAAAGTDTGAVLDIASKRLSVEEKIAKLKERARSTEEGARIGAKNDANMRLTTEQKLEKLKSRARSTEEGARIGAKNDANIGLTTEQKLAKLKAKARSTEEGARIGAKNDANMALTTEQKFEKLRSKKTEQSSLKTMQQTFDQVNGKVSAAMPTPDGMDFESLTSSILNDSFGDLNEQIQAVDLDGTDMIGEMISRPMQAFADVSTAGLGGLPENPAGMTAMGSPSQSLIAPNVTSALTDIENVFAKAGMTPGSTAAAAAPVPALGAAPEMAAGGMTEMVTQLTKLIDLQSRSNKISEKLVRVSTS